MHEKSRLFSFLHYFVCYLIICLHVYIFYIILLFAFIYSFSYIFNFLLHPFYAISLPSFFFFPSFSPFVVLFHPFKYSCYSKLSLLFNLFTLLHLPIYILFSLFYFLTVKNIYIKKIFSSPSVTQFQYFLTYILPLIQTFFPQLKVIPTCHSFLRLFFLRLFSPSVLLHLPINTVSLLSIFFFFLYYLQSYFHFLSFIHTSFFSFILSLFLFLKEGSFLNISSSLG